MGKNARDRKKEADAHSQPTISRGLSSIVPLACFSSENSGWEKGRRKKCTGQFANGSLLMFVCGKVEDRQRFSCKLMSVKSLSSSEK